MGQHRIVVEQVLEVGDRAVVLGDEAQHALRVKRMEIGDAVTLMDGRGAVARARIERTGKTRGEWEMEVVVETREVVEPLRPMVHVRTATPKGQRLEEMIEGLSEVGAASWGPLSTTRGVVDPREGKLTRLARITRESMKQCGRAWEMRIEPGGTIAEVMAWAAREGARVVVAEASGGAYSAADGKSVVLLVGPEGGFTEAELATARAGGAEVCRFGAHVMRIETAGVVGAAMIVSRE
jgi:16S rRNA (uracil1498-N3)-methyltransferase